MIYTFGNSHAHAFTGSRPSTLGFGEIENVNFKSYSLGPVIAYNFHLHHYDRLLTELNKSTFNKEKDVLMLIVGEVDCRWHLPYQASINKKTINEIVTECIDRYFQNYLNLKNQGYHIIGWGGHPSTTAPHNDDLNNPVFGDCVTRNKISLLWNFQLKEKCLAHNIFYISIIEDLIDQFGLTKMDYFDDYCHLNHTKIQPLITKKFKNYIL